MGKNNRRRRVAKKSKKQLKKNNKVKKQNENYGGPVFTKLENPFYGMTDDEHKRAIEGIAKNSEELYLKSLDKLEGIVRTYDPFTLISILTGYGLFSPVSDKGVKKLDSEFHIHQYHVELFQALILQVEESELGRSVFGMDTVQAVWEALPNLTMGRSFIGVNKVDKDADLDEQSISLIQHAIRSNTQAVRNWGYFSQVKIISQELYSRLDSRLNQVVGFSASQLITVFEEIVDHVESKSAGRFELLKSLYEIEDNKARVYAYYEIIGGEKSEADKFISDFQVDKLDKKYLFTMLMSHYDLRFEEVYTFSKEEIARVSGIDDMVVDKILQKFSHAKGALTKVETDCLYLSNPIWTKPLIDLGEGIYFCSIPQVFFSFVMPAIEGMLDGMHKEEISKVRASYLEDKVAEIIERRFPHSNTVRGITWSYAGAEYETDLVTCIDSHILILEAKSGKITEPALRGAPGRLKRHVQEVLVEPNTQSKRLKNRLLELIADPSIEDELREKLPVNLAHIYKIIRVSVSLDDFAMIQANVTQLKETGWLPDDFESCPTMNLADFDTLFDFLEHPVQILHYLECRQEFENQIEFLGDELDLMGFYIETLFNIGGVEKNLKYVLTDASAPLDSYYNSKDAGIIIDKPRPNINPMFSKIFKQLESRKTPRWTEIGVILNRFSPDDQNKIEKLTSKLKRNVEKNWYKKGHKNIVIYVPPNASTYALCIVLFKNENAARRDEFIDAGAEYALKPDHVTQCLIIAKNIDDDSIAYHFIALAQ